MESPSDAKRSLMELQSMEDDDRCSADGESPKARLNYTAVLTPPVHGNNAMDNGARSPTIQITLLSRKLVTHVVGTCLFLAVFTGVAYRGVVVQTLTQEIDNKAESQEVASRVELYNTVSGFLIALVEVMLGVYMEQFLPAFNVYLHNTLWFLHTGVAASKMTRRLYAVLTFLFPVVLMLVIGQCLRSFQATQSSVGFETIMQTSDLQQDVTVVELLKKFATASEDGDATSTSTATKTTQVPLGILQGAVDGASIPFRLSTTSNCSATRHASGSGLRIGIRDLDSANVAYGFPTREWYSEMMRTPLNVTYHYEYTAMQAREATESDTPLEKPDFDLTVAADMFANGKVFLDRAVAESRMAYSECTKFNESSLESLIEQAKAFVDPNRRDAIKCKGAFRTFVEMGNIHADKTKQTPEWLMDRISTSLGIAVEQLSTNTTKISFSKYNLTSQVQMETMVITAEIELRKPNNLFFTDSFNEYSYKNFGRNLCGTNDCLFLDVNNELEIPRQVVMVPTQKGCQYTQRGVKYHKEIRGFLPDGCVPQNNSAIVIALSSFIVADWYGNNGTRHDPPLRQGDPFVVKPRRVIRMTMSKLTWQTVALNEAFKSVQCLTSSGSCNGLSYRLSHTGRFVFASEDALPQQAIRRASLAAPIRLLQLNQARFYVKGLWSGGHKTQQKRQLTPDRLRRVMGSMNYGNVSWEQPLSGDQCSLFMDSYIDHLQRNSFFIERPFEVMYQSAMFYLFSNGSVTDLNITSATSLATNDGTPSGGSPLTSDQIQELGNATLKGDVQRRNIRVVVPTGTFLATAMGCVLLLLVALAVVAFPTRAMEYFASEVTAAGQYFALQNHETYPELVHKKTLLFPATGEALPMADFDVEEMSLVNKLDSNEEIKF